MTTKNSVSNAAHVLLTHCVTTHATRTDPRSCVESFNGATSWEMSTPALAWLKANSGDSHCDLGCNARLAAYACRAWTVKPVKFDGKATVGIASGQPAEDGDPQAEKDPYCSDHSHCNPEILTIAER